MLPPGRHKVPGQIKQGGGLDSARRPCVCHLWNIGSWDMSEMLYVPGTVVGSGVRGIIQADPAVRVRKLRQVDLNPGVL